MRAIFLAARSRLKEILFAVAFLMSAPAIDERFLATDGLSDRASYLSLLALLWSAILASAYCRRGPLRWATALLFSLSAFFLWVFERVTTQFMTYDSFITLANSGGSFGDALVQNQTALIGAIAPALILLFAMGLAPRPVPSLFPSWVSAGVPWLGAAALSAILFLRGGDGGEGLPPSYPPIAYLALAGYEAATGDVGPRQPVNLPRTGKPLSRNVVLVVDESIAGHYLDINSPGGVPTPLTRSWPGVGIYNYGLAASITNCSISTNVTLRYGGTRTDYKRIIATQPSIWAYARSAGMRTVYLDGQMRDGVLTNFMTEAERSEIDSFIQFGHLPPPERDMAIARQLVRELADPRPKFILVNKSGAHFPIHVKYPEALHRYQPALNQNVVDVFQTGKQTGFAGSPPEWVRYRNSYRNALLWNVGTFFDRLLRDGDFAYTTLIYTSDHGQNLHEDGSSGLYTHCGPDPVPEEGMVPLVLIEGQRASSIDWRRDLARNHDRSSHFMIFPTLLELMGYDAKTSQAHYGDPLNAPSTDPGSFNTLFNARLGRRPTWRSIAPALNLRPLTTDSNAAALQPTETEG